MKSWKALCIHLDPESHPPNKPNVYPLHSLVNKTRKAKIKTYGLRDFPGGTVVKNPPANAGDMGSSPGLGRSHMPRSN